MHCLLRRLYVRIWMQLFSNTVLFMRYGLQNLTLCHLVNNSTLLKKQKMMVSKKWRTILTEKETSLMQIWKTPHHIAQIQSPSKLLLIDPFCFGPRAYNSGGSNILIYRLLHHVSSVEDFGGYEKEVLNLKWGFLLF